MESSSEPTCLVPSYDVSTNWTVAGGSLVNSVTFESSLSLVNETDPDQCSAASLLVFCPPSPDPDPCEITLTFAQKHEIRQVYVRSTARVYEIYCATELQSSNDYLCTVRCGIAARDGEVLCTRDSEQGVLPYLADSSKELTGEKLQNGNKHTPNEDDWVEVNSDTSLDVTNRNGSTSNSDTRLWRSSQEFYEATAEINDTSPCMSLTLRLLSLQNKGCVCVDEVYVFADPIDETDLYNAVGGAGYPAGGSFMAMFMPSLLQLSKLKGASQDDKYRFDTKEWQKSEDTESETTKTNEARNELQQKGKPIADQHESSKLSSELMAKPVQLENLPQVSGTKAEIDASQSHSNGVVDQLVSRLNRLEDIMLRFEENMLKPINSIDERLQCVERQLEVLSKKAQNVELLSCTRISAPEFSCSESETNSFYNSGSVCVNYLPCEGNKETPGLPSNAPIATTFSVASELHPSLVVTAPEFSNCDDEEENEEVEQVTEPPEDKYPHIMSIDDALAAAIAGFLSSTSIQCEKSSEIPAVQAQEFTNEEISIGNSVSPSVHFQMASDRDICVTSLCQTENRGAFSSLSHIAAVESDNALCPDDGICVNTGELCCEEECDSQGSCIDHAISSGTPKMKRTDSYQLADNVEDREIVDGKKKILVIAKTDSLEEFPERKIYEDSDTSQGSTTSDAMVNTSEMEGSNQDNSENLDEFSKAVSLVDFETPILEVTFTPQENLNSSSPLEALLAGLPDLSAEDPSVDEIRNDGPQIFDEECNLISVGNWESTDYANNGDVSVDVDYCSVRDIMTLNAEAKMEDFYGGNSQRMTGESLI